MSAHVEEKRPPLRCRLGFHGRPFGDTVMQELAPKFYIPKTTLRCPICLKALGSE